MLTHSCSHVSDVAQNNTRLYTTMVEVNPSVLTANHKLLCYAFSTIVVAVKSAILYVTG
ncbi:hypothetical protein [Shewanella psychromarinicola]|uniref:hypothetical protein n=1 Tax=Shewanella psychromarinicola TaxID=2487742 RepID=UPI003F4BA13F